MDDLLTQHVGFILGFEDQATGELEKAYDQYEATRDSLEDATDAFADSLNNMEGSAGKYQKTMTDISNATRSAVTEMKSGASEIGSTQIDMPIPEIETGVSETVSADVDVSTNLSPDEFAEVKAELGLSLAPDSIAMIFAEMVQLAQTETKNGDWKKVWQDFWAQSSDDMMQFWDDVGKTSPKVMAGVVDNMKQMLGDEVISDSFWENISDKKKIEGTWYKAFKEYLQEDAPNDKTLFGKLTDSFHNALSSTVGQVVAAFSLITILDSIFGPAIEEILHVVSQLIDPIIHSLLVVMDAIQPALLSLMPIISNLADALIEPLQDILFAMIPIVDAFKDIIIDMAPYIVAAVQAFADFLVWALEFQEVVDAIVIAISAYLIYALASWATTLIMSVVPAIGKTIGATWKFITTIGQWIATKWAAITANTAETASIAANTTATATNAMTKTAVTSAEAARSTAIAVSTTATGANTVAVATNTAVSGSWIGSILASAGAFFSGLIPAIISATTATWSFTVALLANPIGLIVAAVVLQIVLFVAYIYLMWDVLVEVFNVVYGVFEELFTFLWENKEVIGAFILFAIGPIGWLIGAIIAIIAYWNDVKTWLQQNWKGFATFISLAFGPIGMVIAAIGTIVMYWDDVKAWLHRNKTAIATYILIAMGPIGWIIGAVYLLIKGFNYLRDTIKNNVKNSESILKILYIPIHLIMKAFSALGSVAVWVFGKISNAVGYLIEILTPAAEFIGRTFAEAFQLIFRHFMTLINAVIRTLNLLPSGVRRFFGIQGEIQPLELAPVDTSNVEGEIEQAGEVIRGSLDDLDSVSQGLFNYESPQAQRDALAVNHDFSARGQQAGEAIAQATAQGINQNANQVSQATTDMAQQVANQLPASDAKEGPLSNLTRSGVALVDTFVSGFQSASSNLGDAFNNLLGGVMSVNPLGPLLSIPNGVVGEINLETSKEDKDAEKQENDSLAGTIKSENLLLRNLLRELLEGQSNLDLDDLERLSMFEG